MAGMPDIVECARHPGVETALSCGRCETPICPSCLVHSPVGARCPDCAQVVKAPMYTLSGGHYVRSLAAALVGGVAMGVLWALLLQPLTIGFFSLLVGVALGYAFTRLMQFATGGKRGPLVTIFAAGGIFLAWAVQFALADVRFAIWGLLAAAIGVWFAYQNLR